jgi:Spy/CpxP family protein refolding chaperone
MKRHVILAAVLGLGLTASVTAFSMPPGGGHFAIDRLEEFSELSDETQALVLETFNSVREENEGLREEIKQAHEDLRDILTADEFDSAAFEAQAEVLHSLMTQGFESFTKAIAELAPQLTQEEREILASLAPGGRHGKRRE